MKRAVAFVLALILTFGLCGTVLAAGTLNDPYSAYNLREYTYKPAGSNAARTYHMRAVNCGTIEYSELANAATNVRKPKSGESWYIFIFEAEYIAGPKKGFRPSDVISAQTSFYSADNERLKPLATATFKDSSLEPTAIKLSPGQAAVFAYALLLPSPLEYPKVKLKMADGSSRWLHMYNYYEEERVCEPILRSVKALSSTSVRVDWSWLDYMQILNGDIEGFRIYRSTTKSGPYTRIGQTAFQNGVFDYSFTDKAPYTGQTNYYKVCAYNYAGNGVASKILSVKPTVPSPAGLKGSFVSYNGATLSWESVAEAKGYRILRGTSKSGPWTRIASLSGQDNTSYQDNTLEPGKTYYYKVYVYRDTEHGTVNSSSCSPIAVSTKKKLASPTGLKVVASDFDYVSLSWQPAPSAMGYRILRGTSESGPWTRIAFLSGNDATSFKDTDVTTSQQYYYKVYAYIKNRYGYSNSSSCAPIAAKPMVKSPAGLQSSFVSYNGATLSWKPVAAATGYRILRGPSKSGPWTRITSLSGKDNTSYLDNTLEPGKTDYYKVYAYRTIDGTNVNSSSCSPIAVSTKKKLASPAGLKASSTSYNSVSLKWQPAPNAMGYRILRGTSKSGPWTRIASLTGNDATSFKDTDVKAGQQYYYKVYAYIKNRYGYSNSSSCAPIVVILPTK